MVDLLKYVLMDLRFFLITYSIYFQRNIAAVTQYENTSTSVPIIPLMLHKKLFKSEGSRPVVTLQLNLNY